MRRKLAIGSSTNSAIRWPSSVVTSMPDQFEAEVATCVQFARLDGGADGVVLRHGDEVELAHRFDVMQQLGMVAIPSP